jgi:coenzyme F420-reducing hydrogenase gamma subunit
LSATVGLVEVDQASATACQIKHHLLRLEVACLTDSTCCSSCSNGLSHIRQSQLARTHALSWCTPLISVRSYFIVSIHEIDFA